jgi:hypothetical protein
MPGPVEVPFYTDVVIAESNWKMYSLLMMALNSDLRLPVSKKRGTLILLNPDILETFGIIEQLNTYLGREQIACDYISLYTSCYPEYTELANVFTKTFPKIQSVQTPLYDFLVTYSDTANPILGFVGFDASQYHDIPLIAQVLRQPSEAIHPAALGMFTIYHPKDSSAQSTVNDRLKKTHESLKPNTILMGGQNLPNKQPETYLVMSNQTLK